MLSLKSASESISALTVSYTHLDVYKRQHVHQAGSYQDASITHFDFTHFSAVTPEELARVQKIVNDKILDVYKRQSVHPAKRP